MYYSQVKAGKLLVAEPYLLDPNFKRSVVLLSAHSEDEGTVGFILNKPINMEIESLLSDFTDFKAEVYYGGPVNTENIFYVHSVGHILDDSHQIGPNLFWGGDYDKLKFLIKSKVIHSGDIKFFVGYSGWDAGQLRDEMHYSSWFTADADPNYVFNYKPKNLWKQVMLNKGDRYGVIAQIPDPLNLN